MLIKRNNAEGGYCATKGSRIAMRGFTLVEILVVVIILGIAAVVAIPMISNTDDMQVMSAARQLTSTLLYAQTVAIASQQQYQLVFDTGAHSYEVQDATGTVVPNPVVSSKPYRVTYPSSREMRKVTLASVDFDGTNTVWFNRLGVPYSGAIVDDPPFLTTGTVILQAGKQQMTVKVEPVTGRVSIE